MKLKRSEVLSRLRGGRLDCEVRSASGGQLACFTDDSLMRIAEWLGVEVEPDEPPLPERLVWTYDRARAAYVLLAAGDHDHEVLVIPSADHPAYASAVAALVAAYNSRPRPTAYSWRLALANGLLTGRGYAVDLAGIVVDPCARDAISKLVLDANGEVR